MRRMSGYDAAFIYDERPTEPQHTLKISVWSARASATFDLCTARSWVQSRLGELPPLRWRALRVPFDLHHPVWVDDPELDLRQHVYSRAIPHPADRRALCAEISEIASHPLDPGRPLWELWFLTGYEGDKVVAVLKMSHALADGAQSRRLIETLYQPKPVRAGALCAAPYRAAPLPTRGRLVRDALRDRLRDYAKELPRQLRATRAARRRLREEAKGVSETSLSQLWSTRTPFCGPLSHRRTFHFATVSLEQAKEIRRALGCTLNDVIVSVAAGAVRSYLRGHRALPGIPVLANMPAALEGEGTADWGNRVTCRSFALPTHLADPIARVRWVQRETKSVKADLAARAGDNLEDWLRWLPPLVPKLLSFSLRQMVRLAPHVSAGVTISNVAGPREQLHTLGGPVENFISVGHMKYAAGLNMTVWSYADHLNIGLYACGEAVPDLWRVADCASESFEALHKAAAREAARLGS